ncbi:MAG: glycosyltransferase [Erysipelotrichaceae bacterium]|nr:glycosyltransferase [Erysipelotrichaceae bacterium]
MNRILVVSSKSYEKARADGLCGKNLKEGFHCDDVFLLGYADIEGSGLLNRGNNEYEFFYHEDKKKKNRLAKTFKRLLKPEIDYKLVALYEKHIESIIKEEGIDTLAAVYFPLETVAAVANIKKKHTNVRTIIYEVDSSTDVEYYLSRLDKYYIDAYKRYMKKIYKYYDYVLAMNAHFKHVSDTYGKMIGNRLYKMDSPVLCFNGKLEYDNRLNRNVINFVYAGFLNSETYSPKPILDFFRLNKKKNNWRLHFYSRGNCEDMLKAAAAKDERIFVHGYVSKEELNAALREADIFLSVSYDFKPNSIPSKVFEYFDANRAVIHFCESSNIFTEEYMNKYPRGWVVYNRGMVQDNDKVLVFIDECLNNSLPLIDARSVFKMNTPEYSADLIKELVNK